MNAASRWRLDAPAKSHQALEAYISLAMTTERNCNDVVHAVGAQDSEGIQSLRARTDNSPNMLSDRETVRKGDSEDF